MPTTTSWRSEPSCCGNWQQRGSRAGAWCSIGCSQNKILRCRSRPINCSFACGWMKAAAMCSGTARRAAKVFPSENTNRSGAKPPGSGPTSAWTPAPGWRWGSSAILKVTSPSRAAAGSCCAPLLISLLPVSPARCSRKWMPPSITGDGISPRRTASSASNYLTRRPKNSRRKPSQRRVLRRKTLPNRRRRKWSHQ